jgi:hypothetical protein
MPKARTNQPPKWTRAMTERRRDERERYHATLIEFQKWCERRRLGFAAEMTEMIQKRMKKETA